MRQVKFIFLKIPGMDFYLKIFLYKSLYKLKDPIQIIFNLISLFIWKSWKKIKKGNNWTWTRLFFMNYLEFWWLSDHIPIDESLRESYELMKEVLKTNKFEEVLEKLEPFADKSLYHSTGKSLFMIIIALFTMDKVVFNL